MKKPKSKAKRGVDHLDGIPVYCRYDEAVDIDKITGHPRNPNKHSDEQIALLAKIIKASGWRNPICVSNRSGFVIKGHGRLMAARVLGASLAPVEYQDYESEAAEYNDLIADNRIAELAERDMSIIKDLLEELDTGANDMDLTGYTEAEIERLMTQYHVEDDADAEPQVDRAEELNQKWQVKPGDLWLIGDHRLLCGDSTKAGDVARLLGDRNPVLMVTDPPYGVEYDPAWRAEAGVNKNKGKMGKVANDDVADWSPAWKLFPGDAAYVYHAGVMSATVQASLEVCGFKIRAQIIWAKDRMALSRGDYHWQHEPCWYVVHDGKPGHRNDDRKQTTLWEIPARDDAGHGHGTQKPLECMARPMRNHDAPEVYDPFLGSGTTMVAGQNLGRKVYGLEITPKYCAVILQRMTDAFPGIKIRREEGGAA
jgi:DNA modification methylase